MSLAIHESANPAAKFLFDRWEKLIETHKASENTEIEIRFGRRSGTKFDTNVGKPTFQKVLQALTRYEGWESTDHSEVTVYYFEGGKRLSVNEQTEEQKGEIKTRVKVDDFQLPNEPLDVRLGISTEVPFEYDGEETSTEQKTKERWSFVRKNLSIDMTIITGNPDDKDSDEDKTYQIELEIIDPTKIQNKIELFNLLYKVFDLMKLL
jgi:mRNA capping enzyme, beta chain